MIYEYRCACGQRILSAAYVPIGERALVVDDQGVPHDARRVPSSGVKINTNRWGYDAFPVGVSSKDLTEQAKQDDAAYEASWNGHTPSKPEKPKSLVETAKEAGLL